MTNFLGILVLEGFLELFSVHMSITLIFYLYLDSDPVFYLQMQLNFVSCLVPTYGIWVCFSAVISVFLVSNKGALKISRSCNLKDWGIGCLSTIRCLLKVLGMSCSGACTLEEWDFSSLESDIWELILWDNSGILMYQWLYHKFLVMALALLGVA